MTESNVFQLSQPRAFADPLTEVLCNSSRAPVEDHQERVAQPPLRQLDQFVLRRCRGKALFDQCLQVFAPALRSGKATTTERMSAARELPAIAFRVCRPFTAQPTPGAFAPGDMVGALITPANFGSPLGAVTTDCGPQPLS